MRTAKYTAAELEERRHFNQQEQRRLTTGKSDADTWKTFGLRKAYEQVEALTKKVEDNALQKQRDAQKDALMLEVFQFAKQQRAAIAHNGGTNHQRQLQAPAAEPEVMPRKKRDEEPPVD